LFLSLSQAACLFASAQWAKRASCGRWPAVAYRHHLDGMCEGAELDGREGVDQHEGIVSPRHQIRQQLRTDIAFHLSASPSRPSGGDLLCASPSGEGKPCRARAFQPADGFEDRPLLASIFPRDRTF